MTDIQAETERRARAAAAIGAYLEADGGDPDDWGDTVTDLLTDLRHVAAYVFPEFPELIDRCVARSESHFTAETIPAEPSFYFVEGYSDELQDGERINLDALNEHERAEYLAGCKAAEDQRDA